MKVLYDVAAEFGVGSPVVESVNSPEGVLLCGMEWPQESGDAAWRRLREMYATTGLWPFLSHSSPREWEWGTEASPCAAPGDGLTERIVDANSEIVSAHVGSAPSATAGGSAGFVEAVGSKMTGNPPYARGEMMRERFTAWPRWICLVAAERPYQVPALMQAPCAVNWTGSGPVYSLTSADHAGVVREWESRYGACVYCLGAGSMVLSVDRPPAERDEAAAVAVQQFAYCYDLDQVVGGPVEIAEKQVPSSQWFFWWD